MAKATHPSGLNPADAVLGDAIYNLVQAWKNRNSVRAKAIDYWKEFLGTSDEAVVYRFLSLLHVVNRRLQTFIRRKPELTDTDKNAFIKALRQIDKFLTYGNWSATERIVHEKFFKSINQEIYNTIRFAVSRWNPEDTAKTPEVEVALSVIERTKSAIEIDLEDGTMKDFLLEEMELIRVCISKLDFIDLYGCRWIANEAFYRHHNRLGICERANSKAYRVDLGSSGHTCAAHARYPRRHRRCPGNRPKGL